MSFSMSLNLGQKQNQSLKQTQRLIMSPQMQQAIQLLQLPVMELSQAVEAELEQNPVLEVAVEVDQEDADQQQLETEHVEREEGEAPAEQELSMDEQDFEVLKNLDEAFQDHFSQSEGGGGARTKDQDELQSFLEHSIQGKQSLHEVLWEQIRETFECEKEREIARELTGYFDEKGFLETDLKEVAALNGFDAELLEELLEEIQQFDPPGVGARTVQECLLIQLRRMGKRSSLAYTVVEGHFDDLLHNRIPLIQKALGVDAGAIVAAVEGDVRSLDLQPGTRYSSLQAQHVVPDVYVVEEEGELRIDINDDDLPPLRLNRKYMRLLESEGLESGTRDYIVKKALSGRWLLKNIFQRNQTLFRITESLLRHQRDFFLNPRGELLPLTMKSVAEELEVHESTVARAVSGKYVYCPRGLQPLRAFFTNALLSTEGEDVSSHSVKQVLKRFIDEEDKRKPLSDEALSKKMQSQGIQCARRTIAKYRRELQIGNTSQRRSYAS